MLRRPFIVALGLLSTSLVGGCAENCAPITTISDVNYASFANIVEHNGVVDPRGQTPLNGNLEFGFRWPEGGGVASTGTAADAGVPMTVLMDGQAFNGTGVVDPDECGNFLVNWSGTYNGQNTSHTFTAQGLFKFYDNRLDGEFTWGESWQDQQSGQVGGFEVLLGLLRGEAEYAGGGTTPAAVGY